MSGKGLINDQVKKVVNQPKLQHIDRVCGSVAEEARIVEISVSSQVHEWLLGWWGPGGVVSGTIECSGAAVVVGAGNGAGRARAKVLSTQRADPSSAPPRLMNEKL